MKKIFVLFTTLLVAAVASLYAGEKSDVFHGGGISKGVCAIVTENNVNVRSKPSMNGRKLFQLNAGDIVTIMEVCEEKMYVDGAWANWVVLDRPGEPCYVLSRWLTSYFLDLQEKVPKSIDFLAYEFFYVIPPDYDPEWDLLTITDDSLIRITERKVSRYSYPSFVPENSNCMYVPPEMSLAPELSNSDDSDDRLVILFRQAYKYGAGSSANVGFYFLDKDYGFSEHVSQHATMEGGYYRKVFINFESNCYDVLNDKWVPHTSSKATGRNVIVTVENMEYDYETGKKVITKEEFNPEL